MTRIRCRACWYESIFVNSPIRIIINHYTQTVASTDTDTFTSTRSREPDEGKASETGPGSIDPGEGEDREDMALATASSRLDCASSFCSAAGGSESSVHAVHSSGLSDSNVIVRIGISSSEAGNVIVSTGVLAPDSRDTCESTCKDVALPTAPSSLDRAGGNNEVENMLFSPIDYVPIDVIVYRRR